MLIKGDGSAIDRIVEEIHSANVEAGWWKDPVTGEDLNEENPYFAYVIGTKIALQHSELSEALEGYRKGKMDDHLTDRLAVEVELADAVIRIFDVAGKLKLNLGAAIVEKEAYNKKRLDHKVESRKAVGGKRF